MVISKYKLFEDVAETRSFTKSAERLGYSQSGVSHILKGLEAELGFPLFVRSKRGVTPTHNAELLLPLIRTVLSETEKLEQTIHAIQGLEAGRLTIATYASISVHWLPPLLHQFKERYPHIDIILKEGGADDILQWIQENIVDLGFLSLPRPCGLDWIPLASDPLMAVLPKDYPLASRDAFPMEEFEGKSFIISAVGTDYDIHHALETCKVHPDMKYSSMDDRAIISMVIHHLGISILSELILTDYTERITALPLKPFFCRELGIAMRSYAELPPAARKFADFAKQKLRTGE
ncbi:MAG: LysR family transcriptional regulator [Ruminococcaceae bacterium]|nr:LysR family transcriptional regulator [Oscillospiraceae bacterium]